MRLSAQPTPTIPKLIEPKYPAPRCDGTREQCDELDSILRDYALMRLRFMARDRMWGRILRAAVETAHANERAINEAWPTWQWALLLTAVGIVAALAGFVAGAVAE